MGTSATCIVAYNMQISGQIPHGKGFQRIYINQNGYLIVNTTMRITLILAPISHPLFTASLTAISSLINSIPSSALKRVSHWIVPYSALKIPIFRLLADNMAVNKPVNLAPKNMQMALLRQTGQKAFGAFQNEATLEYTSKWASNIWIGATLNLPIGITIKNYPALKSLALHWGKFPPLALLITH